MARRLGKSPLGRAAMYPTLFHISLPSVVPRLFLVFALALGLTVLGLSVLIREKKTIVLSLATACVITMLLLGHKTHWLSRVQVAVTPFGAALTLGIALGWVLSLRGAHREGLDPESVRRCLGLGLVGGLLGARLGYVFFCIPHVSVWHEVWTFETGGLFGYGAYFGGLLGAILACRGHPGMLRRWLDVETPVLLGVIGLTRLGCYLEGCDFGRPLNAGSPQFLRVLGTYPRWSTTADGSFSGPPAWLHHVGDFGLSTDSTASLPTHPTQLYEVLFVLVLAALALRIVRLKGFHGRTFLLITLCYSVGRYLLEILRGDPDRGLFAAGRAGHWLICRSWTQLLAVGSVFAVILLWRKWRDAPELAPMGDK